VRLTGRQQPKGVNVSASLDRLRDVDVNYHLPPGQTARPETGWHVDTVRTTVGHEPPGPPPEDGPWAIACRLVRDYQFAEPSILHGIYRESEPLLGRDMLLEGRFYGLKFYLGVRVTAVIDEERASADGRIKVWGWSYETLDGHLEKGKLTYEVTKNLQTGVVEFVISGFSRAAPIPNAIVRWGFHLFGRHTQVRFYHRSGERLQRLVAQVLAGEPAPTPQAYVGDPELILAPADASTSRAAKLSPRSDGPGRR